MKKSVRILSAAACVPIILSMGSVCAYASEDEPKVRVRIVNNNAETESGAAWDGVLVDEWVSIDDNSTAAELLGSVLGAHGYSETGLSDNYITEINGLSAGDCSSMSGWMLMLDNWVTDEGIASYTVSSGKLSPGDELCLAFSLDWGADLGYDWAGTDTSLSGVSFVAAGDDKNASVTLTPEFSADVREYKITVPDGIDSIMVVPETKNKAFRCKMYKDTYTPTVAGIDFKSSEYVKVGDETVIYVGVANSSWHSYLPEAAKESVYTFTVNSDKNNGNSGNPDDNKDKTINYNDDLTVQSIADDISDKLVSTAEFAVGTEWKLMTLARLNKITPKIRSEYTENLKKYLSENKPSTPTEYARLIIALSSIGENAADFDGHDLTKGLSDSDFISSQGLNAAVFALIAFDTKNYAVPAADTGKTQTTREGLIDTILSAQLSDGGWTYFGDVYDTDLTGMALTALAPYNGKNDAVTAAVSRAVKLLSDAQQEDGAYSSFGAENAESCAQVVTALASLGIDPSKDERFVKNGRSVLEALKIFYDRNGKGFMHTPDSEVNEYSTDQGYYAICAYLRFADNKTALYDMSDVQLETVKTDDTGKTDTEKTKSEKSDTEKSDNSSDTEKSNTSAGADAHGAFSTGDSTGTAAAAAAIMLSAAVFFCMMAVRKRNERDN